MVDCVTGVSTKIERFPFEIGSGDGVDFKLNGQGVAERHCAINKTKDRGLGLLKQEGGHVLVVDGEAVDFCKLEPDREYSIRVGGHLLAMRGGRDLDSWLGALDFNQWSLHDSTTNQVDGPMSFEEICQFAKSQQRNPQSRLLAQGLTNGFLLFDGMEVWKAQQTNALDTVEPEAGETLLGLDPAKGLLTCPVCWLKFDLGDVMHIATHDSLRGDKDEQQRFLATKFNDRGQALDALGLPCTETACPHCHRRLPPPVSPKPPIILFRSSGIRAPANPTI